ncbi:MAG: S9 family peptidase [Acidobacteria bacterium]|nr:S9 family peptidase [Acidobacteriota bacterium]
MRRIPLTLVVSVCWLAVSGAAPGGMTLDDVMALRRIADPRLSPDGSRVVYALSEIDMKANEEAVDLWIVPASGGSPRRLTWQRRDDTHPRWSADGAQIAFLSDRDSVDQQGRRVEKRNQVWVMPADGGEAWQLTTSPAAVSDFGWSPDGKQLVYVAPAQGADNDEREARRKAGFDEIVAGDHRMSHLWLIGSKGGKPAQLTQGSFNATEPAWSPKGDQIAFVSRPTPGANEQLLSDVYVVAVAGGASRKITNNEGPDFAPAWSPDGTQIAYLTNARLQSSGAHNRIAAVSASGGAPRPITQDFEYSAGAPRWSADGGRLFFVSTTRTESHIYAVAATGGVPKAVTSGAIMASDLVVSANGQRLAFLREDARRPDDLWTAGGDGTGARKITDVNPEVAALTIADSEVIHWKGADDWEIDGILVKPVGYQPGRRYPLIVEAHGGPHGAQSVGFNPMWQYFAARGYMVLAPNFRGSGGYRQDFVDADRNDWGGKDFVDIMRGVDFVIAQGLADADRLGIEGWSYGGYMTSWIIGHTDRFKVAVAGAAVTNLQSFYGTTDIQRFIEWEYDGFPWDHADKIREHSPITFAPRAKTPTLILHGEADVRVPIEQGFQLHTVLRKVGTTVEFVRYPREGHGFREPAHRRDRYRRTLEWLERYLGAPKSSSR